MLLLAAILNYSHFTKGLDNAFYDWHLDIWSRETADDIVVIAIDDRSLQQLGPWPWPRRFHAKLLDKLHGTKAIGLDIIFAEKDESDPEGDKVLAKAIRGHGQVVLPVSPAQTSGIDSLYEVASIPEIANSAAAVGHVDIDLDKNNISRGLYLRAGLGSPNRPALPVAMYEIFKPLDTIGYRDPNFLLSLLEKDEQVWVRDELIRVPFSSDRRAIKKVSYIDVMNDKVEMSFFKDKWVLIGMNASGLGDRITTPVSSSFLPMAGVEYEAQVLDTLLRDISIVPIKDNTNFLITMFLLSLMAIYIVFTHSGQAWLGAAFSLTGTLLFSILLMRDGYLGDHLWFRPGPTVLSLLVGFFLLHRQQFSSYVATITKQNENAEIAMNTVSDAIIITDNNGMVEFMNPNAEALTGHLMKNVRMTPLEKVLTLQDSQGSDYPIDLVVKSQTTNAKVDLPENHFLLRADGQLMPLRASAKPLVDDSDEINGVIIAFDEFKQRADLSKSVLDTLTQLPNLELLYDRLDHAIQNANRTKQQVAVLYIKLEGFARIRDVFGNRSGDGLLKEIASRLSTRGRLGDTVARIGNSEFIVVLENLHETHSVASVAASLLDLIRKPVMIEAKEVSLESSIGISVYPKNGLDVESLKSTAHAAVNKAKRARRQGGPAFCFFSQEMDKWAVDRLLSENNLRDALAHENFELYYQPRVDFSTGQIISVEAMIRLEQMTDDVIKPGSFMPLAERSDVVNEVGVWALAAACEQAKVWQEANLTLPRIAVNLSPRQFLQHDLLDTITQILVKTNFSPRYLELEITENSLFSNVKHYKKILRQFRELGGTVTIDDFGVGYSSLSYLKDFPVDKLKLDKVFIEDITQRDLDNQLRDMTNKADHTAITLAIINMAHSLNLKVVAEGVETNEQYRYLKLKGCDEMQGYYFSGPLTAEEMTQMLEDKQHGVIQDGTLSS